MKHKFYLRTLSLLVLCFLLLHPAKANKSIDHYGEINVSGRNGIYYKDTLSVLYETGPHARSMTDHGMENGFYSISFAKPNPPCDTVYIKDGTKLIVKVTRAYFENVYYKSCDSQDNSEYRLPTSNIKGIYYATGDVANMSKLIREPDTDVTADEYVMTGDAKSDRQKYVDCRRELNIGLAMAILGLLCFPLAIIALVRLKRIAKQTENQRGFETLHKRARNRRNLAAFVVIIKSLEYLLFIALLIAYL